MPLHLDRRIQEDGFESVEDYIRFCLGYGGSQVAEFYSAESYKSLLAAGLLAVGMFVRTSDAGVIDQHYRITEEGKLEGVTDIGAYPGREGIFEPDKLLTGDRISSGWSVEGFRFQRLCREKGIL